MRTGRKRRTIFNHRAGPPHSMTLGSFMLRGSCLCGGVRYEITGPLSSALNCHCSMCRKAHGAAFRSRARVRATDFRWVQGEELVTYYESSPGNHRGFCRACGSPLLSRFLTAIRLLTAFLLERSTMIRASNPSAMYSSQTKRRGSTLPMSYHNSRSFRRKLPNRPFDTDLRKRASPTCSAGQWRR